MTTALTGSAEDDVAPTRDLRETLYVIPPGGLAGGCVVDAADQPVDGLPARGVVVVANGDH